MQGLGLGLGLIKLTLVLFLHVTGRSTLFAGVSGVQPLVHQDLWISSRKKNYALFLNLNK